jgi:spore germination protein GerM
MSRKTFLIILLVLVAGAAAFYYGQNYMIFNRKTVEGAVRAYQLYSAQEKQADISLYFGDPASDGLLAVKSKIYETPQLINQAKQAIMLLLEAPPQGALRVMPEGTLLRDAYLDSNGTLYVDFSQDITLNHTGGTTAEYLTVYSVLNTMFANFNWIKGVRFLIDGKEAETLAGHISLSGIFRPEDLGNDSGNNK